MTSPPETGPGEMFDFGPKERGGSIVSRRSFAPEHVNGKLRDWLLNGEVFSILLEASVLIEQRCWDAARMPAQPAPRRLSKGAIFQMIAG